MGASRLLFLPGSTPAPAPSPPILSSPTASSALSLSSGPACHTVSLCLHMCSEVHTPHLVKWDLPYCPPHATRPTHPLPALSPSLSLECYLSLSPSFYIASSDPVTVSCCSRA